MLINFLDPRCKPIVYSSVPCSDGFDVKNLVSDNPQNKSNGFLAYSCIRPPVDLEFNLICSVNLHYIIVIPSVGAQKSISFELSLRNKTAEYYQPVCVTHLQNDEVGLVFYNGRTFQQKKYDNIPPNYKLCPMKNTQWRLISTCDKLRLRILRTKSSIPCIGKIEVWGHISKACSSAKKSEVLELYNTATSDDNKSRTQSHTHKFDLVPSSPAITGNLVNTSSGEIPDEFLDSLTFEVMSLPITLPSGNTIDQSTLEKHNQTQEIWGRKPFDPFTGQIFTDSSQPIFNSALKNRIDNFLLQNKDEVFTQNIARTVGRSKVVPPATLQITESQSKKRSWDEAMDISSTDNIDNNNTETNLDIILTKTLSKLKRFSTISPTDYLQKQCVLCKCMENLYILKCSHLYCRSCLTKTLTDKCATCNQYFQKCDINRYHV